MAGPGRVDSTAWTSLPVVVALGFLSAALIWAMAGVLTPLTVLPTSLLISWAIFRRTPRHVTVAGAATPRWFWLALLVALGGWSLWVSVTASELVLTGRDGATYLNIAKGLQSGGDLIPATVVPPFDDAEAFEFESPGWRLRSDGRLYQQFLHAMPAAWAVLAQIFGEGALMGANTAFGATALLAFFGLVRVWLPTSWATGAVAVMAASFPMVYYSRSTFTEPAAMALIAGGSMLFIAAHQSGGSTRHGQIAGLVLGGSTLVRIDSWMVGLALASASLILTSLHRREDVRLSNAAWTAFLGISILGILDLLVFSLPYLVMHRNQMLGLIGAAFLARIAAARALGGARSATMNAVGRLNLALPTLPTVMTIAAVGWVFVLRPVRSISYGATYGLAGIEPLEGLPGSTGRNYLELAGLWPAWYLGYPALIAALAWVGALSRKRMWKSYELVIALVGVVPSLIYFIAPSVNPDHPWAVRRLLPIVLPLVVGLSWQALRAAGTRIGLAMPWSLMGGIVAFLLPTWLAMSPFALVADGDGSLAMIKDLCKAVDGRPIVIVDEETTVSIYFLEPIRRWCGVPVAAVDLTTEGSLPELPPGVALLSTSEGLMREYGHEVDRFTTELVFIQERLLGPPRSVRTASIEVFLSAS